MRRLAILVFLASAGLSACQEGPPPPPPGVSVAEAVASITEADFLRKVSIIADDSMMGRGNPSPGLDMTAQWVADEFQSYGLVPGGDNGSYIQALTMRQLAIDFEGSGAQVTGGAALEFGADLSFMQAAGGGSATGTVVVMGGDLASVEDYSAHELAGKHVFVVPAAGAQTGRRFFRAFSGITEAGAASLIIVDQSSDADWETAVTRARDRRIRIAPWDEESEGLGILTVRSGSLGPLLAAQGIELSQIASASEAAIHQLSDLELSITVVAEEVGSYALPNSVGILEGSDPELKDEYIVFSAHMDHVGIGRPDESGDSIRNGADDDASGTISVVELAEAFSMAERPRRSIIFLGVAGEEAGLLGSRYFAENPSVPLEQIVANVNSDMISRNATDSIVVIGKEHSDMGSTMDRVNAAHPELNLTASDDIWPEQNFYGRSDHFNFARRGVPILFFFCGTHEDYHGVNDEVENMDISKATRTTQLMFYLGMELANADEQPQWDPASRAEIVDGGSGGR